LKQCDGGGKREQEPAKRPGIAPRRIHPFLQEQCDLARQRREANVEIHRR